jgi:hypothetical protein
VYSAAEGGELVLVAIVADPCKLQHVGA